jgi:Protein of unknown function (DUF2934)
MHKKRAERFRAEIEKLAYLLWEQRGRPSGSPEKDWLRAERQLRQHYGVDAPSRHSSGTRSEVASARDRP